MRYVTVFALVLLALSSRHAASAQPSGAALQQQVRDAERSFAGSMASRDFKAFGDLVAQEAVFFGDSGAQRGKPAVLAAWQPLFDGPTAPFSWEPELIEVVDSGTLAFSSGPVKDRSGRQTGVFNSVWRREAGGAWKVVFDKGCPVCNCPAGR